MKTPDSARRGSVVSLFKRILNELDVPKNDWVLSRYGGCEPSKTQHEVPVAPLAAPPAELLPARSADQPAASDPFVTWFEEEPSPDTVVPRSGQRVSSSAAVVDSAAIRELLRKSEAG